MAVSQHAPRIPRAVRTLIIGLVFVAIVVLLIMWLAGAFHEKVTAERTEPPAAPGRPVGDRRIEEARILKVPREESAVGSIEAVHEASVASKLLAKVNEVNVQAGQAVSQNDLLVRLDDKDLRARLEQADAALQSAKAARDQAGIELDRIRQLYEQNAAAKIELDRAETAAKTAAAEVQRAEQAREEAQTMLEYATIRSPLSGIVIDKQVEAGDTVSPGQVLLTMYDPTRMQLIATVRESLTQRLAVDQTVRVRVDAIGKTCQGRVSEIVPEAEASSRSFAVKVTGPCPEGIYTGMFGRLLIPLDEEEVLVIPQAAVRHVGQLDIVEVAEAGRLYRRSVRLGRRLGDNVQVLAGLQAGEQVALWAEGPES